MTRWWNAKVRALTFRWGFIRLTPSLGVQWQGRKHVYHWCRNPTCQQRFKQKVRQ